MVTVSLGLGASGVGSKVWVLTIGVLEVNPERDSIRAQRERARSVLFSQVVSICHYYMLLDRKARFPRVRAARGWSPSEGRLPVP